MIKLREWATIRSALRFRQGEMCPSGSTIRLPYYDVDFEESLVAEEVSALRAKLSNSCVRYAGYDPATSRLTSSELVADADEVQWQAGNTSMIATVIIPANTQPNAH